MNNNNSSQNLQNTPETIENSPKGNQRILRDRQKLKRENSYCELYSQDKPINQKQVNRKKSQKNKQKQQNQYSHTEAYHSKTPDLLIQFIDEIIRADKLEVLRLQYQNLNLEQFENFSKYTIEKKKKDEQNLSQQQKQEEEITQYQILNCTIKYNQFPVELPTSIEQQLINTNVKNIELIRERAINNTYFEFQELEKDFHKLFLYTILYRCRTILALNYMINLITDFYNIANRKQIKNKLQQLKIQDLERLFKTDIDKKYVAQAWPFIPQSHRKYQEISTYSVEPISDTIFIQSTLQSDKKSIHCPEDCACMSLETLGDFSLENMTWNSKCPNRKERMECTHHECKNSQGRLNQQKINGQDIQETLCWGIDLYTKKNLYYILHENECENKKHHFIQKSLLKAANLCGNNGWDMSQVCQFIILNSKQKFEEDTKDYIFNNQDRKFAKLIQKTLSLNVDPEAFRLHSKGMGVICLNRQGIEKNDLIIQYYGEIYRPYRWFERQDFVKKFMKENNQKDILPDFYNIMLEVHKNDPKGYDILYVDPIQKGNYSSRLSHSCDPNCGTVATISNGQYNISMFAMKSIEYGEELAFDYSAVTESKQEHMQATCLCGTYRCRGKYIEFNNNNLKEYNFILEKIHCFLKRNSDLLRCCNEQIENEDLILLEKHNIRQNVIESCPKWFLKWISIILKTINEEKELFLQYQMETNPFLLQTQKDLKSFEEQLLQQQEEQIKEDIKIKMEDKEKEIQKHIQYINYLANSKVDNRIQNLVISIDKVKYFLNRVNDFSPPLQYLTENQILQNLCSKGKESILDELYDLLIQYRSQCGQLIAFLNLYRENYLPKYAQLCQNKGLLSFRLFCLNLSEYLQKMTNVRFHSVALSITLYFYAFTHTYFTPHEYISASSEKMTISETEMQNLHLLENDNKKRKKNYEEQRVYSPQFVWGQLTVWFKQTIASPQATLSQDRRGTLSFPSLNQSFNTDNFTFPFQEKNDKQPLMTFLNHLKSKPKDMWPPEQAKWSYKNNLRNYGTLLFEGIHNQNKFPNLINKVIDLAMCNFEEKFKLFIEVEKALNPEIETEYIQIMQNECFEQIKEKLQNYTYEELQPEVNKQEPKHSLRRKERKYNYNEEFDDQSIQDIDYEEEEFEPKLKKQFKYNEYILNNSSAEYKILNNKENHQSYEQLLIITLSKKIFEKNQTDQKLI